MRWFWESFTTNPKKKKLPKKNSVPKYCRQSVPRYALNPFAFTYATFTYACIRKRVPLEIFWFRTIRTRRELRPNPLFLCLYLSNCKLYKVVHPDSDNLVSAHGCRLTREWSVIVLISQHARVRIYTSFISLSHSRSKRALSSRREFMRSSVHHLIRLSLDVSIYIYG